LIKKPDVITAFEVLEHTDDPLSFMHNAIKEHSCKIIIFSTILFKGKKHPDLSWWYYAFEMGQHIIFYNKKTLQTLAKNLNLNFYSYSGIHIFSDKKILFSPLFLILNLRFSRIIFNCIYLIYKKKSKTFSNHKKLLLK
jgi:2-polyprenyl-3-methyl-5-hydroxy-6-metoxy-1,4-benzoquinol methylase